MRNIREQSIVCLTAARIEREAAVCTSMLRQSVKPSPLAR